MGRTVSALGKTLVVMLLLIAVTLSTAIVAGATSGNGTVTWTTQGDFETNASTVGTLTTRAFIDTTSSPGDVKIGGWKDFVSTATMTYVTAGKKIYSTSTDRTSIAVIDGGTQTLTQKITLPAPATGVVYNPTNNKLYVGQYKNNTLIVINCSSGEQKTIAVGNGPYAAVYNPDSNKIYVANIVDQTVSIINGQDDTVVGTVGPVVAGANTATYDSDAKVVYLTNKANSFTTVIKGDTNEIIKSFEIEVVPSLLGGQVAGNVGLRADAQAKNVAAHDAARLSWNYDALGPKQNVQFQARTGSDLVALDGAQYLGPDGTPDKWYDASNATTVAEDDDTKTSSVDLNLNGQPARFTEIQLKLSSDGITSPVLHSVSLVYQLWINASAGPGGTISPAGTMPVEFGADQTFIITPDVGHKIVDVLVDNASDGAVGSYTFYNVNSSHTIAASFAINRYTLAYSTSPGGTIDGINPQVVDYGGSGTQVCAVGNPGYHFVSWEDGVATPCRTDRNVTDHLTVKAIFAPIYTITATAGPGGSIDPKGPTPVYYDGSVRFNITPNTGCVIAALTADNQPVSAIDNNDGTFSYWFRNVRADHTIDVSFKPSANATLQQVWTVSVDKGGYSGVPDNAGNYYGTTLAGGGVSGSLFRLNANGIQDWQVPMNSLLSVAADNDGSAYVQDSYGRVLKYRPSERTPQWIMTPPSSANLGNSLGALTVDNKGYVYTLDRKYTGGATTNYYIYKVRTSDGSIVWSGLTPLSVVNSMAVDSHGAVYVTSGSLVDAATVYKFDPAQGSDPVASFHVSTGTRSALAIDKSDNIYVVCADKLAKIDTDGNVAWSTPLTLGYLNKIATDGVNVYFGHDYHMSVYDAGTGGLKQSISNVPVTSNSGMLDRSQISTDGYGVVFVHGDYNAALSPITKYVLR